MALKTTAYAQCAIFIEADVPAAPMGKRYQSPSPWHLRPGCVLGVAAVGGWSETGVNGDSMFEIIAP